MSVINPENVKEFLQSYIVGRLQEQGRDLPLDFSDDCDLLLSGIIDSLGLLELMTAIQKHYDREIDFDAIDTEQMTIMGPLSQFVSDQMRKT
jgi:acyl carrier protein